MNPLTWSTRQLIGVRAILTFALAFLAAPQVHAGTVTLICVPPTANSDGSSLTNLAGYRAYYGTSAGALTSSVTVASPATCGATIANLANGTWYFAMTSYRADGAESIDSATVSKAVGSTTPPTCPAQPSNETRSQSCAAPTTGSWTQAHGWTAAASPTCWAASAWTPTTAPAGACVTPPPPQLLTAGPYSYELTAAGMSSIGLIAKGLNCGPSTKIAGNVKFCEVQRAQTDLVAWPADKTLAAGIWARAQ